MSINIYILFGILIVHWIADFCLQTDYEAKNKSKSNKALLSHTGTYSICWMIVGTIYGMFIGIPLLGVYFSIITFIAHTITDYITSRINSRLYTKGDIHNFFVSLGLDQLSHYIQLILTFYFLTNS